MTMTSRETILKAFAMEPTERVPVTLFGGGMWSIKDYGTSFEELSTNVDKNVEMCIAEAEKRSDLTLCMSVRDSTIFMRLRWAEDLVLALSSVRSARLT
jgi:hypothetical protein